MDLWMNLAILLVLPVYCGIMYRMRGGMIPHFKRPIDQILCILPLAYITYMTDVNDLSLLVATILSVIMISKGHGVWMSLGRWKLLRDGWLKPFLDVIFRPQPRPDRTRDKVGLMITGMVVTIPFGYLMYESVSPMIGILAGLSGGVKTLAYQYGWNKVGRIVKRKKITQKTKVFTKKTLCPISWCPVWRKNITYGTGLGEVAFGGLYGLIWAMLAVIIL